MEDLIAAAGFESAPAEIVRQEEFSEVGAGADDGFDPDFAGL